MKELISVLLLCGIVTLSGVSIYEIQHTVLPGGDNTFPSRYAGRSVTVEGIVTAVNYRYGGFFLSEPAGGPWRSIYVTSANARVRVGDKLVLQGVVSEYYGMTCIQDVRRISVLDSNYPVPLPSPVTSGQLMTPDQAEAYECVLVRVMNANLVSQQGKAARILINDGSGTCQLNDLFPSEPVRRGKAGDTFTSVSGIVCYSHGEYSLNPRTGKDISVFVPVFNQTRSWGRIKSIYK